MNTSYVENAARRILGKMQAFELFESVEQAARYSKISDQPVGHYLNRSSALGDVVIGRKGIYLVNPSGEVTNSVAFAEMTNVALPARDSKDARQIKITRRDGTTVVVPILGSRGKFFDAYEVARFLKKMSSNSHLVTE